MADEPCCDDDAEQDDGTAQTVERTDVGLETELPAEVQAALGRFVGRDAVETLGEWARTVRRETGDGPIAVGDLCETDEVTAHWGSVDGDRRHFACFYDAVILAALLDRPVDIHTESPAGTAIEVRASGDGDLTVNPETAVFSVGIDPGVAPPTDEESTLQRGYAAICPYVRAFPDREAYEAWAGELSAPTVAMPLAGATDLAAALATPA